MEKTATICICLVLLSFITFGQKQANNDSRKTTTEMELQRIVQVEKDSKAEEIIIDVKEGTQRFHLKINSSVTTGKLTIELYDPLEAVQGSFTIGTQLSSDKKEHVNGIISKSFHEPPFGKWKIKIIPTNATGKIHIETVFVE